VKDITDGARIMLAFLNGEIFDRIPWKPHVKFTPKSQSLCPFYHETNASCIIKLNHFLSKIPTVQNAPEFLTYIWPAAPTVDDGGR
jgi:hypothetical protein